MTKKTWTGALLAGLLAAIGLNAAHAQAQNYPNRPVRIIVPYVPGGTVDLVARVLAQRLTEQMGQPFVVENRAGASGVIGSDVVAKAAADGYTLLVQSPTLIANPLMVRKVPYDVITDFTPVSFLGSVPMVVAAHPSVPADNLQQFLEAARAKPQGFSLGTSAIGSPMHVSLEAIKFGGKLEMPIVAYRGTAAALNDLLGGQISVIIDALPSTAPHIASGKLKALAVTTKARIPSMPNVPTVAESGIPGFEMVTWYGLWAPGKLPEAISKRLTEESAKAMRSSLVTERLGAQGFVAAPMGPAQFAPYITKEIATYARIVRDAKIQID
jgi:tripartite-type tricarboxylate transporter receptor subunit TctC